MKSMESMKILKSKNSRRRGICRALIVLLLLFFLGLAMTVLAVADLARLGGKESWSDWDRLRVAAPWDVETVIWSKFRVVSIWVMIFRKGRPVCLPFMPCPPSAPCLSCEPFWKYCKWA
jgi:hypothetical protein